MVDNMMYVLTTEDSQYGATKLLDEEFLAEVSNGVDYYIIPSSVHEAILLPASGDIEIETVNDVIRMVNATEVKDTEVLSDHAYLYNAKQHVISIAA